MNFRPSHISFARLVDWVEKRLPIETQSQVQTHLATCVQCQREAAQIERMLSTMRSDTAVDPPPGVVDRAVRLFDRRVASTPTLRQQIMATLRFDSLTMPLAFGTRSGALAPRQLLFNAGDYDLDLRITPSEQPEHWLLSGQLLGVATAAGTVVCSGATTYTATLSSLGEFTLPPVASGTYTLAVQLPDVEMMVGALTL